MANEISGKKSTERMMVVKYDILTTTGTRRLTMEVFDTTQRRRHVTVVYDLFYVLENDYYNSTSFESR